MKPIYMAALAPLVLAAGPISKFDNNPIVADYVSARAAGDVERCLIDIGGHGDPLVYRQPDRPDDVTIVWLLEGGLVVNRMDLRRLPQGTHVRSWNPLRQASDCAPRS